jgi:hypothetical protein
MHEKCKKMIGKGRVDLRICPRFDPIPFKFSENSNYWRESLLEM